MPFELARHVAAIENDGYTVIDDFLAPPVLAEVRRVLARYLGSHSGRNAFEGVRTERVYTLVARARVFWDIALDHRILALCDRFLLPNYLLTASQAISVHPGEVVQSLHSDDTFYRLPRPRDMVSLSTIVAVDPFTELNGATRLIPGSHRWSDRQIGDLNPFDPTPGSKDSAPAEPPSIRAAMPAGACLVFSGMLIHGGSANHSDSTRVGFSNQYCQPWARAQENFILGVPAQVARAMPARLQELLGYSIHPPFIGQLTASHPAKSLEPDYENRVEAQARAIGEPLPDN